MITGNVSINPDGSILLCAGGDYNKFDTSDELEIYAYKNKITLGERPCTTQLNTLKKSGKQ